MQLPCEVNTEFLHFCGKERRVAQNIRDVHMACQELPNRRYRLDFWEQRKDICHMCCHMGKSEKIGMERDFHVLADMGGSSNILSECKRRRERG